MMRKPSDAPAVQFVARRGGKSQELIDQMLAKADERGVRVEVVYPQGEPSDAQVEVAWRVWLGLDPDEAVMGNWIHEARMKARAALRAAFSVGDVR